MIAGSCGDAAPIVDASGAILHAIVGYWQPSGDPKNRLVAHDLHGHALAPEASPPPRAPRGGRFARTVALRRMAGAVRQFEVEARPLLSDQRGHYRRRPHRA
jgi:hypothetical protein